jgi:putative membrane protein
MRKHLEVLGGAVVMLGVFLIVGFTGARDPFFNKASQANLAEIQAGKLAEQKGGSGVRKLGKEMVTDHSIAENELITLAKKQGLKIAMAPDAEHKQALADLSKLSGKSFDSAYMASQFIDHKDAVALFTEESQTGIDPSAKTYAGEYLPKLQMHLQMFEGNGSAIKTTMDSSGNK